MFRHGLPGVCEFKSRMGNSMHMVVRNVSEALFWQASGIGELALERDNRVSRRLPGRGTLA